MGFMDSRFFSLLRQQAGPEGTRLILACCGGGLAQGLCVFSVLQGLEQLADGGVEFQTFLLFLVSLGIFYYLFHYTAERAALLALRGIMSWRIRLAAKLRGLPMERFGRIRDERVQMLLLDSQEMVVEASRMLMVAFSSSAMMVVAVLRMFTVSFWGATWVLLFMASGLGIFLKLVSGVNRLMQPAHAAEMDFSFNLRDLLAGFQHLKVHLGKTVCLFRQWLLPGLETSATAREATERQHALGITFFAAFDLLALGLILFLLPSLVDIAPADVTTLLVLTMFCLSPMMSLVGFVPMLAKVESSLNGLAQMEKELDEDIEPSERVHAATLWDAAPLKTPAFENLCLSHVHFAYHDDAGLPLFAVSVPHFELQRGEIVFLSGGNGAGKTTLMRLICGLYTPQQGEFLINGRPLAEIGTETYRNMFSLVPADFHLFQRYLGSPCPPKCVRNWLELMRLESKVQVLEDGSFSTRDLSAGQRKRLALVSALLEERDICLFDEVAADFDPYFRRFFYTEMLPMLRDKGKTILAVSHDDRYFSCANRVLHMEDGTLTPMPPQNFA